MADSSPSISNALDAHFDRAFARIRSAAGSDFPWTEYPDFERDLRKVVIASDFFADTICRQPGLLRRFVTIDFTPAYPPTLDPLQPDAWPALLRRYRAAESARLVWRDVLGLDDVEATLAGATQLAEACLGVALDALEQQFEQRYGRVVATDRSVQRLVVFGLGKLGGGELNFSSDVDLVYAYPQAGESDGARPLAGEEYFARLGQQLARLLDETTADGFCHRVDLRLRPFGTAGRVALSFAAMDQYFQREGRDWERYAWFKARAVAGDIDAGEAWLVTLRPFVYRRYLDFTALDGLREMKAAITAEVTRQDRLDDIKRGPGGIREIEFLVQSLQLIRGGREAPLRERRLLSALDALVRLRQIGGEEGRALADAYRFLRRVENRLQMLRDAQTYALPTDPLDRERIALGLDFPGWSALTASLEQVRATVSGEFAELLAPRRRETTSDDIAGYWRALPEGGDPAQTSALGFADAAAADRALRDFSRSLGVRELSDVARARLDRVVPALLRAASASSNPDAALSRVLGLLQAILRRTSYLALLDEQPSALARLVDVLSRSALLAERIRAYPLLLDELLDTRIVGPLPDRETLRRSCRDTRAFSDTETALRELNERRQALSFRVALALLDGRQDAESCACQLAWLAEAVVERVYELALAELILAHGRVEGGSFAIIGYGSLGGIELGFGSDLDLVFLYDHPRNIEASDGPRPLEPSRWFARLAQKVMALLGAETGAGHLYDIDVRLRPDGGKGALVSSLASYREYQRERAWTWEHQALVRARAVAGDDVLRSAFVAIRAQTLAAERDPEVLRQDVARMRRRMREELDRSTADRFDLKQGDGGLVDLEFLLQYHVLGAAGAPESLLRVSDTSRLIGALRAAGRLDGTSADALQHAHAILLDEGLRCTLDRRPRIVHSTARVEDARRIIRDAVIASGLREVDAAQD